MIKGRVLGGTGIVKPGEHAYWTKRELRLLRSSSSLREAMELLPRRSEFAIYSRRSILGLPGYKYKRLLKERFMEKVRKTSGCWIWTASRHVRGYGTFQIGRKAHKAHRVSYEIHIGPIPKDKNVLHKCDNPPCVKPKHLYSGNQVKNARDMMRRERGNYKLSWLKVAKIRSLHRSGISAKKLGRIFKVSCVTIREVAREATWNEKWRPS